MSHCLKEKGVFKLRVDLDWSQGQNPCISTIYVLANFLAVHLILVQATVTSLNNIFTMRVMG